MSMADINALLRDQKAEQKSDMEEMFAKQRDVEKEEREKDKDNLVQEFCAGVKEEISVEMKPIEDRTVQTEKKTEMMGDQVKELYKKVINSWKR